MPWVRSDREILPRPSAHTSKRSTFWCWYCGSQSEAQKKVYRTHQVLNPGTVVCKSITLSARTQLLHCNDEDDSKKSTISMSITLTLYLGSIFRADTWCTPFPSRRSKFRGSRHSCCWDCRHSGRRTQRDRMYSRSDRQRFVCLHK